MDIQVVVKLLLQYFINGTTVDNIQVIYYYFMAYILLIQIQDYYSRIA